MLDIRVTVQNDQVVIKGLNQLAAEIPVAVRRGLKRIAAGVYDEAFQWLSGPGRTSMRLTNRGATIHEDGRITKRKSSSWGQSNSLGARPGSYPVPILTGHLRRLLDWLSPGDSITGESGTFSAGPNEVVIYDSAAYADVIKRGKWTSAGFGPRDFLGDALTRFNEGARIAQILEEEIQFEIAKRG
jgi:hypothetical protein